MATPLIPLSSPAGRVLAQLRHGPMTVEELARAMRITSNAVRNQLARLQEANLVVRSGSRPGISKPSSLYAITLEGQTQFSTIYLPVLTQFLHVEKRKSPPRQLDQFMRERGQHPPNRYPRAPGSVRT